jgi:hypothetical protein
MSLVKKVFMVITVSALLSSCGPAVAAAVQTAAEIAPVAIPVAVDVSTALTISSAELAAGLSAGLTEADVRADYRQGIIWEAEAAPDEVHADKRHGVNAQTVRDCLEENGAVEELYNPETERYARVCNLSNGGYGVRICSAYDGCEITAFPKEKMSQLEQVVHYLQNVGYKFTQ